MPVDYSKYEPEWVTEFRRCEGWLEAALEYAHGAFDIQDVFEDVMNGSMQFWPGESSVAVTQVVPYPKKKIVHCFLAAGDIVELEVIHDRIVAWAKTQGCEAMTLTGRPGWTKSFLRDIGYTCSQVQMVKEF
jgi:hypothetical protein